MSKTLTDISFLDLLPPSISGDIKIQGAAAGAGQGLQAVQADVPAARILARIDELPEAVIDLLGWQFHVDYWDSGLALVRKRDLVKKSIRIHRTKGTPGAIETILQAVGFDSEVIEWFEYAGDPYRFKVDVDLTGETLSGELVDKLLALIRETKNARSWLDGLVMSAVSRGAPKVKACGLSGEVATVYPWAVSEAETLSPVYAAAAFLPGLDVTTIYPKEAL